jgi:hypothetical protein
MFAAFCTHQTERVWGWGFRSAARSSKPTTDDCGRPRTSHGPPSSRSRCLPRHRRVVPRQATCHYRTSRYRRHGPRQNTRGSH